LCFCSSVACRTGNSESSERQAPAKSASRISTNEKGQAVVSLDADTQRRIGLKTEEMRPATLDAEIAAYGKLLEDPSEIFVLRAPVSGTLRRPAGSEWPEIGQMLADGVTVGSVEPRLAPMDRLTLADRLSVARADLEASAAALVAARSAYERAAKLNADSKNVSDRTVQEAEARMRGEEARAKAARETVQLLESSLKLPAPAISSVTLAVERGGEVVEIMAQPGESVEAGQPVLRAARFSSLMARVDIPAGQALAAPVATARISALGREDRPLQGRWIGLAAAVDPNAQGQAFLFRVENPGGALRPGLSVTAYLRKPGEVRKGTVVQPSAVIRAAGKTWVYVQQQAGKYVRCEVTTDYLPGGRVFVSGELGDQGKVVTVGAQILFSEESKSQIQVGDEGGGD
jgi:cobalt-zinc-cadmium efflux system membrane fusion protein